MSELGDDSKINPNFLINTVGLIHESHQIGVDAVKNYQEKGIEPSLELHSKKVGNEKINATAKPEEERRKQQKNLECVYLVTWVNVKALVLEILQMKNI